MEGQKPMTRGMVGVEMLCLQSNGIMEFKEAPTLKRVNSLYLVSAVSDNLCLWPNRLNYFYNEKKFLMFSITTDNL